MDKGQEMAKTSAVGSFQLFLGRSISTIILAIGSIVIGFFIADTELGLYTIALVPATTILLFQDWGVATALIRYCAKYRASNEEIEQRKIIVAGLVFEIATGIILTVVCVAFASFIGISIFGEPQSVLLIIISSVTILTAAIANAPGGIFTGFEQMRLITYVGLTQAVAQTVLAPLLVYLGYGALGAIIGLTAASVASAIVSMILLYTHILRKLQKYRLKLADLSEGLKPLLHFGTPLAIGNIMTGLLGQFYAFMMAAYVDVAIIGNNKIASNFALLLTIMTYPIITVLFPAFSKLDPVKEKDFLKTVYASSVKYTVLFIVPTTLALIVLSQPLVGSFYGTKWESAPFLLSIGVLYNLLALFGWRSFPALLQATGDTKIILYLNSLSLLLSIPIAFFLVPTFGIVAIVLGVPGSAIPSTFIGIYLTWKRYSVKPDFRSSAKILLASVLAMLAVYALIMLVAAPDIVLLLGGLGIFLFVFLVSAPIIGAITQTDIANIRSMFSNSAILKVIAIPLWVVEKSLFIFRRQSKESPKKPLDSSQPTEEAKD